MFKKICLGLWNNIKILMCMALIIGTFYFSYSYLSKVFINKDANYGNSFHNMPENSVDILVLGSSHAQYSFVPSLAYQDSGLYSYVLGSACQPIKVSYEMLKEALKTQSPELIILEVYTTTPLSTNCEGDVCYVSAEYQMRGQEKQNVINFLPEEKAETYRNDFVNNHNNWRTMQSFADFKIEKDTDISPDFGYVQIDASLPPANSWFPLVYDETPDFELDEEDLNGLNNILDLCKKNNMELFLYMMPVDSISAEDQGAVAKVWQWAESNNIKYLDFVQLARQLDYRIRIHNDGAHSFSNGASFITDYLMSFIKENYSFTRHKENEELNNLYKKNISNLTFTVLSTEYNPDKYLNRLINYPETYIIKYDCQNSGLSGSLRDSIIRLGLDGLNNNDNYYAIVKNGETIIYSNDSIAYELDGHYFEINDKRIAIDDNTISAYKGLNLVVFANDYNSKIAKRIDVNYNWDYNRTREYTTLSR